MGYPSSLSSYVINTRSKVNNHNIDQCNIWSALIQEEVHSHEIFVQASSKYFQLLSNGECHDALLPHQTASPCLTSSSAYTTSSFALKLLLTISNLAGKLTNFFLIIWLHRNKQPNKHAHHHHTTANKQANKQINKKYLRWRFFFLNMETQEMKLFWTKRNKRGNCILPRLIRSDKLIS